MMLSISYPPGRTCGHIARVLERTFRVPGVATSAQDIRPDPEVCGDQKSENEKFDQFVKL
jgi:hypothetical protein